MTSRTEALYANLRQMIAVLEAERQALATLDADELVEVSRKKQLLCDELEPVELTRELVTTASALNEVNRRVRNLLAANVAARLEVLGGSRAAYSAVG